VTSRLASLLVQDGLVSAKKMAEAFQRQVIYGGTLDTILLEMDVVDEGTLLDALGRSSALPIAGDLPSLEQLQAAPGGDLQKWMPQAMTERFRAVPVALDGSVLRVLVIDPPDRKQLDELGYTLSVTVDPIIVPEHRFVQAVELVYGVPVPARFASLAAKLRQRATDPNRARLTVTTAPLPMQPAREQRHPEPNAPMLVGDRIKEGTPTEPQRVPPMMAQHAPPVVETARKVVTDVPMPAGHKPATAPASELPEQLTPRLTPRQAGAPTAAVTPEAAARTVVARTAVVPSSTAEATPLSIDEARAAIDGANDRDGIFESLCRGTRARLPFAAILTVHGDLAAGKLALGSAWLDKNALAGVAVPLDRPSPFRAAAMGRAPYLGRLGDDELGAATLAQLARKPPLPALLMPVVLRERAVALLYADNDGRELDADVVAELSTLVAAAARSFQRLILRAKGGEYAKAAPVGGGKLQTTESAEGMASGGAWRRPTGEGGEVRARSTHPRFSVALVNAVKDELQTGNAMRSASAPSSANEHAAPGHELHDAPTQPLADVDALVASVERQDEHAQLSADALVAMGQRAALALVAHLPGPLRLDRHTLRGATPPLAEHGPLLAVLQRLGRTAREALLPRLGDASLEVRYYATLALGELRTSDVVAPLGARLYDPDAGVRRAAVEALSQFGESAELTALVEQMRAELPGPDAMRQRYAAEALGVMRDVTSVPRLIELVKHQDSSVVAAARKALVEVTKQDFGTSRWRWRSWWERHRDQPRVEWMLEGLAHAEPEVRLSAAEELRAVSQMDVGYTFDGPKREREESRKKWIDWVRSHPPKQQDKR
jgi:HEAT repeat protein